MRISLPSLFPLLLKAPLDFSLLLLQAHSQTEVRFTIVPAFPTEEEESPDLKKVPQVHTGHVNLLGVISWTQPAMFSSASYHINTRL